MGHATIWEMHSWEKPKREYLVFPIAKMGANDVQWISGSCFPKSHQIRAPKEKCMLQNLSGQGRKLGVTALGKRKLKLVPTNLILFKLNGDKNQIMNWALVVLLGGCDSKPSLPLQASCTQLSHRDFH